MSSVMARDWHETAEESRKSMLLPGGRKTLPSYRESGGSRKMADQTVAELRQKIVQAREVIAHLMEKSDFNGAEAHRALDYFGSDAFDRNFLPWPHQGDEGLKPEELNAANDD
ncbi:hypothetical protein [Mesorhizobium dulcispinae]|uniref:hypothetical protein n=1 Tax=Mesorhizobium dulcispinae TaxID=3072316 RepID=UPI002A23CA44|nr:hypothetical protein [Mesorhizobium sp. VK23D]